MTYDERQELAEYLEIVKKNCQRLMHSIELTQGCLDKMKYTIVKEETGSTKEDFLKHY